MSMHDNDLISNDNILDQLRAAWTDVETPPPFHPAPPAGSRISSRRDRLRRSYTVQLAICIVMAVISVPNMLTIHLPLWIGVALTAFFCLMAVMVFLERSEVEELDFGMLTPARLLSHLERLERLRSIHIIAGCITGLPLLMALLRHFADDTALLAGGCAGAIVGATIGLLNNHRNRRIIRSIREELTD